MQKKNSDKLNTILKIVMVVLALVAVGTGYHAYDSVINANHVSNPTISTMEYRLEDKNYDRLNDWICDKEASFKSITPREQALGNVGKYYSQAVQYYALKEAGIERANDYYKRMLELKGELGEYQNQAGAIDDMLSDW